MMDFAGLYRAILEKPAKLPLAFSMDGVEYTGFPFPSEESAESEKGGVLLAKRVFRLRDNLKARLELEYDSKFDALAWTVWFENDGVGKSPVLSDVDAARVDFAGDRPRLLGILGDHENDYRPYDRDLTQEQVSFYSDRGRPTHVFFPYFNLVCGNGGCLSAIGWGGTWEAKFGYDGATTRFVARGTNGLRTYLLPGESVRTPRILLVAYEGRHSAFAMNKWREYYVSRVLPKDGGKPLRPFSTTFFAGDTGLPNSDGSISERYFTWKPSFDKMLSENIEMDFRWFDAGWYVDPSGKTVPSDWWGTVGTWQLDPEKWPGRSFRDSTDYARAHGMRTLMWFEPERVTHVDELVKNWGYKKEWALGDPNAAACGNDIGQRDCLDWTVGRILKTLNEGGVELYREDNNFDARPCWADRDRQMGEDRTGITENRAVAAHYEMWDRIIAFTSAHGGCAFVDSCASGGGRNDLESMRRAVPILRSDADRTTTALRLSMTASFNLWIPFCGASCTEQETQLAPDGRRDTYVLRASYLPILNLNAQWTQDPHTDYAFIRRSLAEWKRVNPYLLKEFYPLTPWHDQHDKTGWTAFAFLNGDEGVLLAFRREECGEDTVSLSVPAWGNSDVHTLTDADSGEEIEVRGSDFQITRREKRSSALYSISKRIAGKTTT